MRKIILNLAASFDGFIEGPNGEIDWIVFDQEGGSELTDFLQEIDTVLYGRVSYEMWGSYNLTDSNSDFEKSFYGALDNMKKYVFSSSKDKFDGNPIVIKDNIAETISELQRQPGKNIWLYGGAALISTFMNLNLIDEFRIAIMPVIIGKGKPLFKEINTRLNLKLAGVKTSHSGVMQVCYKAVK
ncbi:dihydrofolate reductase family protein [Terrimonas alba]|uniref:dihydrofolate reductase family protein n=1 Tax=Terrimonas alba TaxID=3349636 RepID=UPI0035F2D7E0